MFILTPKKQCATCGEWKDKGEFYKDKRSRDGLYSHCKTCHLKFTSKWKKENPDKVKQESYIYVRENAERRKQYRKDHPEQERMSVRKYYENNLEKISRRGSEYRKKNLNKLRLRAHNRRARIKGNGGEITEQEWIDLCDRYGNKCLRCGATGVRLTLDHVIPILLGGKNVISNAQPLCLSCNSSKGTKTIDYRGQHE